jgi:predicted nucleic acid-binding Zn ribbon protein
MHINLLYVCGNEVIMINFNNKKNSKTKRVFAAIIIVILVLAMVLPMAVSAFI